MRAARKAPLFRFSKGSVSPEVVVWLAVVDLSGDARHSRVVKASVTVAKWKLIDGFGNRA
jgi:hypothetical protein